MTPDSRIDTYAHVLDVQRLLVICITDLQRRLLWHDISKLSSPEKEAFDALGERIRGHAYGSEEYRAALREAKHAIVHHHAHNAHHPEYWPDGIRGMSLVDLLEMVCDWVAASKRQDDGKGPRDSMNHNQERWGFSDELKQILLNTLDLIDPKQPPSQSGADAAMYERFLADPGSDAARHKDVIVNGQPVSVTVTDLSYHQAVGLAYPGTKPIGYTVIYQHGHVGKPEGSLVPGEVVCVRDGMIITVVATDAA